MTLEATAAAVIAAQKSWARRMDLDVDPAGYLADYASNLRASLSPAAKAALSRGSGSELEERGDRAAKMRALHSSSALAVNIFDFWTGRDLARVLAALGVDGRAAGDPLFEEKLPTGARGTPPNLDVVVRLDDGRFVGVESKFTEWMSLKHGLAASLEPYVDDEGSFWSRAGLHASHSLVVAIRAGEESFHYLDVPQLLKHALGLNRASMPGWFLRYLYFDAPGKAQEMHAEEIARFDRAVGAELRFHSLDYQEFIASLGPARDEAEAAYIGYLNDRYFGG